MMSGIAAAIACPAGVAAILAGLLSVTMCRSLNWYALARGWMGGTVVVAGSVAAAVYSSAAVLTALFSM